MRLRFVAFAALSMLALVASACSAMNPSGTRGATQVVPNTGGSSATSAPAATMPPAATMAPATSMPPAATQAMPNTGASGAQVMAASNPKFGSILTDAQGRTLYLLTKDGTNMPTCYASCAQLWPPLLANGKSMAGSGLDASKLGTAMRTDGGTQVTYNGHPLYYFAQDMNPGDTNGQGFSGIWFVVSPSGDPINK